MSYSVRFNKEAYKGRTKADFVESEKHHSDKVNLSDEYDKMFPDGQETKKTDVKAPAKDKNE